MNNNPFDDTLASETPSALRVTSMGTPATSNPFDDPSSNNDDTTSGVNPFSESSAYFQEDDDDVTGAPVEASWQYLGDLPYRRVPVYGNVRWGADSSSAQEPTSAQNLNYGLSAFPKAALEGHPEMLNLKELRELLASSTITKVVGCPYGGPVAAVTLPIVGQTSWFRQTEIRILTNGGKPLAKIQFPLMQGDRYSPSDIMEIGFTSRTSLVIVLRDSLCLTYDLSGTPLLPPFWLLPYKEGGSELMHATVFEGGAAALSTNKHAAICELLDEHDDPAYLQVAPTNARRITSSTTNTSNTTNEVSSFCGLVTPLPTAAFASEHFFSYVTIAVLSRTRTASRHPEIFLSTTDNSVVVVDAASLEIKDLDCRRQLASPIVEMIFAPNGRFLACFTEASMLTVISTTFETKVLDFDTSEGSSEIPLEMKWCGEDSVVLHWKNLGILMVGPYGDWLRFPYESQGNLYLIPEVDCCRVVTDVGVELLQRVPPATSLLLRIGSIEPAAMLLDAADAFESASTASEDAARAITKTGMLQDAIQGCVDAAAKEFDIATQQRLLKAASFGMHFAFKNDPKQTRAIMGGGFNNKMPHEIENALAILPSFISTQFVETARKLRILNAVRNPNVGLVLTSGQYDIITATGVIARLIAMAQPSLATSISKYLALPKSVQLLARASKAAAFVSSPRHQTLSDSDIAQGAIQIIHGTSSKGKKNVASSSINRGGYATVAMAANKIGRPGVANLLLMLETSVADKVPALISTGSYADAVAVATSASDADLIFHTIMEYQKYCMTSSGAHDKANQTFMAIVTTKFTKEAFHTLRKYMGTMQDIKNVINLQLRAQKFTDAGVSMARRALEQKRDSRERQSILAEASRVFGMGKETAFHKACTDDFLELLKDQEVLRTKYSSAAVAPESSSVTATISSVLEYAAINEREKHRLLTDADKIAKKFRVPDKMVWHTKVQAFARTGQWANLRMLADSRAKPPIGFKPFARAAIRANQNSSEMMRYIDRVSDPEERFGLLCEASMWKPALEEAFKMRDEHRIMNVKASCNNSEYQILADQMLAELA